MVRLEGKSSEIRARNDRTAANMSDKGFERGAAAGAATAAKAWKNLGAGTTQNQDGASLLLGASKDDAWDMTNRPERNRVDLSLGSIWRVPPKPMMKPFIVQPSHRQKGHKLTN